MVKIQGINILEHKYHEGESIGLRIVMSTSNQINWFLADTSSQIQSRCKIQDSLSNIVCKLGKVRLGDLKSDQGNLFLLGLLYE